MTGRRTSLPRLAILALPLLCVAAAPDAAERRARTPASQPAADSPPRMQRLEHAEPGEWAVYRMLQGAQRVRLINTTRLLAEFEVLPILNGQPLGLPAVRTSPLTADYALDLAADEGATVEFGSETVDAAGRAWTCRRTVARRQVGAVTLERRIWMSADAPLEGLVRMELRADGRLTARLELLAFGFPAPQTQAEP